MLEMTDPTASKDLWKDVEQAMEAFNEAGDVFCYIYSTDFCLFIDLHEADSGEELLKSMVFLLCHSPHNVIRQTELESTSHDVFGPEDNKNF